MNAKNIKIIVAILSLICILGLSWFVFSNQIGKGKSDVAPQSSESEKDLQEFFKKTETVSENSSKLLDQEKFNDAIRKAQAAFAKGDYDAAITDYNNAIVYGQTDTVYAGLYTAYTAKQDWVNAMGAIDKAIEINPLNPDYWKWKLSLADEKTDLQYSALRQIYEEGKKKVRAQSVINLTTHFAVISERSGWREEAVQLWEEAKQLYPDNAEVYQKEIDRLRKN